MLTLVATLELRSTPIPDGPIARLYAAEHERLTGDKLTHEHRHYLAGEPVHCGDMLELYHNSEWICGRYEWNPRSGSEPTLETADGRVLWLDSTVLLRWPER